MILLDTQSFIWMCVEPKKLSKKAATAIRQALSSGGIAIASITLWETAMLIARGRLVVDGTAEAWIARTVEQTGVVVREITPTVAALATQFADDFPRDPADRMIAATARAEGLTLVTSDEKIRASSLVTTIW